MSRISADKYPEKEAQERFDAALRGARIAGHRPMESMARSKARKQRKPRKKTKAEAGAE